MALWPYSFLKPGPAHVVGPAPETAIEEDDLDRVPEIDIAVGDPDLDLRTAGGDPDLETGTARASVTEAARTATKKRRKRKLTTRMATLEASPETTMAWMRQWLLQKPLRGRSKPGGKQILGKRLGRDPGLKVPAEGGHDHDQERSIAGAALEAGAETGRILGSSECYTKRHTAQWIQRFFNHIASCL